VYENWNTSDPICSPVTGSETLPCPLLLHQPAIKQKARPFKAKMVCILRADNFAIASDFK
jgi:hypothetical protein